MTSQTIDRARFEVVRSEWLAITQAPPPDEARFRTVKREADRLVDAGLWTSGPSDMLSVLGRQRDELVHSRLIAWLLGPTNRHGLGRRFLTALADQLWPGEQLLRSGSIVVETEVPASGVDDLGRIQEARADIVLRSDRLTIVIENKLDAGEQPEQCERLYWAWAGAPGEARWVFLTPTGRDPVTATSAAARAAWLTLSYVQLRALLVATVDAAAPSDSGGRATVAQYLASLPGAA